MSFAGYEPPERNRPGRVGGPSPVTVAVVFVGAILLFASYQRGLIVLDTIYLLVALIPAVIIHEVSHGYVASRFGDSSARFAGRLTLWPTSHFDLLGMIVLPILLVLSGAPPLGYAKPMPVNVSRMTKNQALVTGLAGSALNFLVAGVSAALLYIIGPSSEAVATGLVIFGVINVVIGALYLLPIPPLDGSAVVERFLPYKYMEGWTKFKRWSLLVLLVLFLFLGRLLTALLEPFLTLYASLLP